MLCYAEPMVVNHVDLCAPILLMFHSLIIRFVFAIFFRELSIYNDVS